MVLQPTRLDVLVIAPHPDDAELGMGGAILKMIEQGLQVGILDLTNGEPTPHGSVAMRAAETESSTQILKLHWRGNLGLPNRSLEPTIDARAKLAGIIRLARPKWLFGPFWIDAHPDHLAATQLVEAARFWAKLTKTELPGEPHHPERLFYYYCVHLKHNAQPAFVLNISEQFERKMEAISCYASQFIVGRHAQEPTFLDQLRHEAAYWGKLIGTRYGEPFASREPVGLGGFRELI